MPLKQNTFVPYFDMHLMNMTYTMNIVKN